MKAQNGLLVATLLIVVGCSANPTVPTVTPPPEPPTAAAEVTASVSSNPTRSSAMTTYVDQRSGVAFDYPNGWSILEPPADGGTIYSYSVASFDMTDTTNLSKGGESSVPPGQTKMDITFYGADETPESASRTVQSDVDSGFVVIQKQETRTAPDGSPAYYYEIQGRLGGGAKIIYTHINGHTMSVTAYGDGAHFEDVVNSLRVNSG